MIVFSIHNCLNGLEAHVIRAAAGSYHVVLQEWDGGAAIGTLYARSEGEAVRRAKLVLGL